MSSNKNLNNMLCLDAFLQELSTKEYQGLKHKIVPNQPETHILLSYDIASLGFLNFQGQMRDSVVLGKYAKKFVWQTDLKQILNKHFQALVLTDLGRKILWVNEGFEQMTGYKSYEAIGKKPHFLQGEKTEESTRSYFREKLKEGKKFETTITNYRKDGDVYLCKVEIFPLYNEHKEITHFLALEQEI